LQLCQTNCAAPAPIIVAVLCAVVAALEIVRRLSETEVG
jgi:hypothetical protein